MTDREHDWTPIPDSEVGYDAGTFRAFRCRCCGLGLERDSARSLPDGPCEPPDREREARIRERGDYPDPPRDGTTHYEGCWQTPGHHNCAVARVDRLEARAERYRGALEVITRFGAELTYADAFNEIQRIAHRTLNDGEDDG